MSIDRLFPVAHEDICRMDTVFVLMNGREADFMFHGRTASGWRLLQAGAKQLCTRIDRLLT
jgi:hypothetical protein